MNFMRTGNAGWRLFRFSVRLLRFVLLEYFTQFLELLVVFKEVMIQCYDNFDFITLRKISYM